MFLVPIFAVFLATVGICWSEVPPSQKFSGIWTVNRILPIKENGAGVYSCYKVTNEIVNDTTVNTTINYKLNGEPHTTYSYTILKSIDKTDGETFLVEQYAFTNDQHMCSFNIKFSTQNNVFATTACEKYGIREWCLSRNRNAPEEIIQKCPTSKKYKELDNSNC